MPKTKIVTVCSENPYIHNLLKFVEFLNQKLYEIPEEYRSDASVDLSVQDDYSSYSAVLEIYYYRPLTVEELLAEEKRQKADLAERKRQMLKEIEELEKRGI